jgi:hypothetical protein
MTTRTTRNLMPTIKRLPTINASISSVHLGDLQLGTLMLTNRGWLARDYEGITLGTFPDRLLAVNAIIGR